MRSCSGREPIQARPRAHTDTHANVCARLQVIISKSAFVRLSVSFSSFSQSTQAESKRWCRSRPLLGKRSWFLSLLAQLPFDNPPKRNSLRWQRRWRLLPPAHLSRWLRLCRWPHKRSVHYTRRGERSALNKPSLFSTSVPAPSTWIRQRHRRGRKGKPKSIHRTGTHAATDCPREGFFS